MEHFKILPENFFDQEQIEHDNLELAINTYFVTIAFPPNQFCLLSTLQFRFENTQEWKVVSSNVSSHNREITIRLGGFNPENTIQLFWMINATITDLTAIAIYIVNKDTGRALKVAPLSGVNTIKKGGKWMERNTSIPLTF